MESNNDYSHLLERIKGLNTTIIERMSSDVMANLTDGFKEPLVREMLYTTDANYDQRKIIKAVKTAYKKWKKSINPLLWNEIYPKYPQYMEELQMDIECGCVVTAKGTFAGNRLKMMPPIPSEAVPLKSFPKANQPTEQTVIDGTMNSNTHDADDKDKMIAELRETLSRLRADFEQYRQDHEITQEELDAIFERDDSSEHNSPLRKDKKKLQNDDENSKLLAEKDAIIKEQEERIADYAAKFDPQDINKKKFAAMTGKQHAIFLLAVLAHNDRLPHARTNLSFLLSFIASRNETTMCDYLKERFTQDECETLAKVFDTDCPFIAKMIRELPEKLEKDKSEKNRAKALKNNNA